MVNEHLISVEQFKELARPTSKHVDDDEVMSYVRECEDIYIEPAIGLDKLQELLASDITDENKILLEGGNYKDETGKSLRCAGLQKALAYFVYAKMSMADGSIITRSGMVQHNDSYAQRDDDKNRIRKYDDVMNVAEAYLSSSMSYLKTLDGYKELTPIRGTRVQIHAIGD